MARGSTGIAASRLPPAVAALLLQILSLVCIPFALRAAGAGLPPLAMAALCGLAAALLSLAIGLDRWWLAIQLVFAPLLVLALQLELNPWYYFGGFVLLSLVYWSTFRTRVPLYLSGRKVWPEVAALLPVADAGRQRRFIDLGCGLGGLLLHLARARPDMQFDGIELAPLPAAVCRLRAALTGGGNCHVAWGSFWNRNLADYDVVFAFLSPVPMPELWRKARAEMRPGSLLISSTFTVPGQPPERTVLVDDARGTQLHLWRF
jgi:hypothetical protein